MKRFIDLGTQLYCPVDENDPESWAFAWWDTVVDEFESFDSYQVFDNWDDFEACYKNECYIKGKEPDVERYARLYPKGKP